MLPSRWSRRSVQLLPYPPRRRGCRDDHIQTSRARSHAHPGFRSTSLVRLAGAGADVEIVGPRTSLDARLRSGASTGAIGVAAAIAAAEPLTLAGTGALSAAVTLAVAVPCVEPLPVATAITGAGSVAVTVAGDDAVPLTVAGKVSVPLVTLRARSCESPASPRPGRPALTLVNRPVNRPGHPLGCRPECRYALGCAGMCRCLWCRAYAPPS
jgi:hypothetical protein